MIKTFLTLIILSFPAFAQISEVKYLFEEDIHNKFWKDSEKVTELTRINSDGKAEKFQFVHYSSFLVLPKISEKVEIKNHSALSAFYTTHSSELKRFVDIANKHIEEVKKIKEETEKKLVEAKKKLETIQDDFLKSQQDFYIHRLEYSIERCNEFMENYKNIHASLEFQKTHDILYLGKLVFPHKDLKFHLLFFKYYKNNKPIKYIVKESYDSVKTPLHYAVVLEKNGKFTLESLLSSELSFVRESYEVEPSETVIKNELLYNQLFESYFFSDEGEINFENFNEHFKIPESLKK